jgi:putative transposase
MPHGRPQRLLTFNYIGCHRYFLTFCVKDRDPLFRRRAVVELVSMQILRTSERYDFAVIAYVFMPDHLHLLVEGITDTADLRQFARAVRRASSNACWDLYRGGIWQDGYFERTLRGHSGTQECIDYILNNPVRAGLVERALDYPYSWCRP